jgi:hypothetical protein
LLFSSLLGAGALYHSPRAARSGDGARAAEVSADGLNRTPGTVPATARSLAFSWAMLAVLVVVSMAGCGAAPEATPAQPEAAPGPPPESTLSHGGRTVVGTLGPYCWEGVRSPAANEDSQERCGGSSAGSEAASGFPPFTGEALTVPEGAQLRFLYGGGPKPDEVSVEAVPLQGDEPRLEGPEGRPVPLLKPPLRRTGKGAEISAALPAGEYGMSVWIADANGYAYYGFRVLIK